MLNSPEIQTLNLTTIGHGTRDLLTFLSLLKANGTELLADVRTMPFSRFNPQYNRDTLKKALADVRIAYTHIGNKLGGRPNNERFYQNGRICYDLIKETEEFKDGIIQVCNLTALGLNVTLMCSERDPNECHRKHLLAGEFEQQGVKVWHINKTGHLERHQSNFNQSLFS